MMTILRPGLIALPLAGALLAGCASSGDGEGGGGAFDSLEAQADGMLNEVEDLAYSDPATLPTSGAATYQGVVGLNFESIPDATLQGVDMAGDLSMTVNFAGAGDQVTGTATNFVGIDDAEFTGTLILDDGSIDRMATPGTTPTFTAEMAGVLTDEAGTDWTVDTGLSGNFAGEDYSHAFGTVDGTGCNTAGCTVVGGQFIGER